MKTLEIRQKSPALQELRDHAQLQLSMISSAALRKSSTAPAHQRTQTTLKVCRRVGDFLREMNAQFSSPGLVPHDARSHAVVLTLVAAEEALAETDYELHEAVQVTAQGCLIYARLIDELSASEPDQSICEFCESQLEAINDFLGDGDRNRPKTKAGKEFRELVA